MIFITETKRPTTEMVLNAWDTNKDGGGVAWRHEGKVKWMKGITDPDQMVSLSKSLPKPFIMHFRVASVGGVRPDLTHPFIISNESELDLEGESDSDFVLFHNGDWREWRGEMLRAAKMFGARIPDGKFSDSRCMAWLCHHYGPNFVEAINEKVVMLSHDDMKVFTGNGWAEINGVWCSNSYFMAGRRVKMCREAKCYTQINLDENGYCVTHARTIPPIHQNGNSQSLVVVTKEVDEDAAPNPTDGPKMEPDGTTTIERETAAIDRIIAADTNIRGMKGIKGGAVSAIKAIRQSGGTAAESPFQVLVLVEGLLMNKDLREKRGLSKTQLKNARTLLTSKKVGKIWSLLKTETRH